MKKVTFIAIAVLFLMTQISCFRTYRSESTWLPACERNKTGEICFFNDTKKDVKISIGKTKTQLTPNSTRCIDMYEGDYEYKAKQGFKKWEEYISVNRCDSEEVRFFR